MLKRVQHDGKVEMKTLKLLNYTADRWVAGDGGLADVHSAITGDIIATTGSGGIDFSAMLDHPRTVGGPALRQMSLHARPCMLHSLAQAEIARKEALYQISSHGGAARWDGGINHEAG